MSKVLVEIFIPSIGQSFDVFIPLDAPMYEVLELIKKSVYELSEKRFIPDNNTSVFNREKGLFIDINLSVYELGIKNGSRLMLI